MIRNIRSRLPLAIGAMVLLAGTAALAADSVTVVGTFDRLEADTLYVKTSDGMQSFDTSGIDIDPTLAKGDLVRVSYTTRDGSRVANVITRAATVSVTLPDRTDVEKLVIEEVQAGSLASIAGKGEIQAKVMLSVANHLTIRTADPDAPVVAFRAQRPAGTTQFRQGELIRLRVPEPVAYGTMDVHTEPVGPPERETVAEAVTDETEATEPETETSVTATEPVAAVDAEPAMTEDDAEPTAAMESWQADEDYRLPQTASAIHLIGAAGAAALAGAALLAFAARRIRS